MFWCVHGAALKMNVSELEEEVVDECKILEVFMLNGYGLTCLCFRGSIINNIVRSRGDREQL